MCVYHVIFDYDGYISVNLSSLYDQQTSLICDDGELNTEWRADNEGSNFSLAYTPGTQKELFAKANELISSVLTCVITSAAKFVLKLSLES